MKTVIIIKGLDDEIAIELTVPKKYRNPRIKNWEVYSETLMVDSKIV